ncbi:MAG: hypothetical protein U0T73_13450 [Chitinophagales bacterium]
MIWLLFFCLMQLHAGTEGKPVLHHWQPMEGREINLLTLNGKVKTVKVSTYNALQGQNQKLEESSIREYDSLSRWTAWNTLLESGDTTFMKVYSNAFNRADSVVCIRNCDTSTKEIRYTYDLLGRLIQTERKMNGKILRSKLRWLGKYKFVQEVEEEDRGVVNRVDLSTTFVLNKFDQYVSLTNSHMHFAAKFDKNHNVKYYEYFNKKGNHRILENYNHTNQEKVQFIASTKNLVVHNYEFVFDQNGNWIRLSDVKQNGDRILKVTREFTYY